MPSIPTRRALLLDLAAAIGLGGPALMVLDSFDSRPGEATMSVVLLLIAAIVIWVLWRRSGQRSRTAAIAFVIVATATLMLGNGVLYYGIIWAACLMLGVTFARGAVVWGYAAALVTLSVALHLSSGSSIELLVAEAIGAAFFTGIAAAVAGILRDSFSVGEALRGALEQLDAANAELRGRLDTDRDLVLAEERERTARELHDGLGHRLTAIGLSLDYAARVDDSDAARDELRRARDLVGESLDAMRRLVRAMHPVELSTLGNAEAFRAVAEAFRGTGIDIRVAIEGDDSALSHERSLLLLRFVQEGLTNVVRHSNASEAELRVVVGCGASDELRDGAVNAVLEDRGGPSSSASAASLTPGFGLRSLRARAEALGGTLDATPTASGFRLSLALPTPAQASVEARPLPASATAGTDTAAAVTGYAA
ncbi:sensor histidine kinase [Agreia sp. VKM Ac-1783]|uniref:sensor histidine kinase n=1 Tax=Agreia sp. VKM Ac-1783 TaxID=1938889 RepID=UPI000A2AEB4D|nr:sensor histidine kinase [Agreia sp. VKM Ac-1783]SMQ74879.1 Signal transduction histidine kinase [Agreia sp. VKM Ac-1783]